MPPLVALLAEGVDRNLAIQGDAQGAVVALLAEGVDRNQNGNAHIKMFSVALLAEGVDRNGYAQLPQPQPVLSPSSQRAWIEIGFR